MELGGVEIKPNFKADGYSEMCCVPPIGVFMRGSLVQCTPKDYIAPRKVGLDIILANPVGAGTQQP